MPKLVACGRAREDAIFDNKRKGLTDMTYWELPEVERSVSL